MKTRYYIGIGTALLVGAVGLARGLDVKFNPSKIGAIPGRVKRALIPNELSIDIDRDGDVDIFRTRTRFFSGDVQMDFYENRKGKLVYRADMDKLNY